MNKQQELWTINQLKHKLEQDVHKLVEEYQRRPECRGVQIQHIVLHQIDWHNGYDEARADKCNPELQSGPDWGYRLHRVEIKVVLP